MFAVVKMHAKRIQDISLWARSFHSSKIKHTLTYSSHSHAHIDAQSFNNNNINKRFEFETREGTQKKQSGEWRQHLSHLPTSSIYMNMNWEFI